MLHPQTIDPCQMYKSCHVYRIWNLKSVPTCHLPCINDCLPYHRIHEDAVIEEAHEITKI